MSSNIPGPQYCNIIIEDGMAFVVVEDDSSFTCKLCGKNTTWKNNLLRHIRIHMGHKPFKCRQCEKSFSDSSNLKKHMAVHLNLKFCPRCHMFFETEKQLKDHILSPCDAE